MIRCLGPLAKEFEGDRPRSREHDAWADGGILPLGHSEGLQPQRQEMVMVKRAWNRWSLHSEAWRVPLPAPYQQQGAPCASGRVVGLVAAFLFAVAPQGYAESATESLYYALQGPIPPSSTYVTQLLANGADPNAVDEDGDSVMLIAPSWSRELGDSEIVRLLLEAGGDATFRNEEGETPLHNATTAADVRLLVSAGGDPNAREIETGWTPLMVAINAEVVTALVEAGAAVDARDRWGATPLHYATDADIALTLIAAGADLGATDDFGSLPLFSLVIECFEQNESPSYMALGEAGASLDVRTPDGLTLLHHAAMHSGCAAPLKWLIDGHFHKADLLAPSLRTPLSLAAGENESIEVLEYLLAAGADPTTRCADSRLPLHWAARGNSNPAVVATLLALQENPDEEAAKGVTPLMLAAARNENPKVVEVLLKAGANVNATAGGSNSSPLILAAKFNPNGAEVMWRLIKGGALLTHVDANGLTPLMWAAGRTDSVESLRHLLVAGVPVDQRGGGGRTALMQASAYATLPDVVTMLLDAGADASLQDEGGIKAIDLARENEHLAESDVLWRLNDASY